MQNRISNSTRRRLAIQPEHEPAPIALVAIDLDGTLLRSDKSISERTVQTVAAVTGRGVSVVLASARPPRGVRAFCQRLGLHGVHVSYNGALIYHNAGQRHLYHQPVDGALAKRIVGLARQIEPSVVVNIEILDRWYTDRVDPALHVETSKQAQPDYLGPIEACIDQPVTKMMFLAPPGLLLPVRSAIEQAYGHQIAVVISDRHVVQVVHARVNKAHALQWIVADLGISARQVMAIGDAPNDVEMIRWAGLGVVVENGWHEARLEADVVVASNDDDGVADALRRYVLGQ